MIRRGYFPKGRFPRTPPEVNRIGQPRREHEWFVDLTIFDEISGGKGPLGALGIRFALHALRHRQRGNDEGTIFATGRSRI